MQKKKKLRASSQRKVSSAKQPSGLIAKGKLPTQSAGTKSALDNRSHRTAAGLQRPFGFPNSGQIPAKEALLLLSRVHSIVTGTNLRPARTPEC